MNFQAVDYQGAVGVRQRLDGIEALRGFAALSIVLFHMIWIAGVRPPSTVEFIKYFLGFGVPLFFVISAFSLSYGYLGRLDRSGTIRNFYIRRLARIAPLLYFMLAVQLAQAWLIYGATVPIRDIILNATFLFNFSPRLVDGIVAASWSIGVEMIFYFILPALLYVAQGYAGAIVLLALSVLLGVEFSTTVLAAKELNQNFAYHSVLVQMPYFFAGLLGLHVYRSLTLHRDYQGLAAYSFYFLAVVGIVLLIYNASSGVAYAALWGAPFALVVIAISLRPIWLLVNALTLFWGRVSFSLYLTHPHIIFLFHKAGFYQFLSRACGDIPLLAFPLSAAITIGVVSAVSWVTFNLIEVPGMAFGRRVASPPQSSTL